MSIDEDAFQAAFKVCSQGPVHSLREAIEEYERVRATATIQPDDCREAWAKFSEGRYAFHDTYLDPKSLSYNPKKVSMRQEYWEVWQAAWNASKPEREISEETTREWEGYIHGLEFAMNHRPLSSTTHNGANTLNELREFCVVERERALQKIKQIEGDAS